MSTRRHVRRPGTPRHDRHLRAVDEPPAEDAPDEFLANVAQALAEPEPLAFLSLASAIVSTFDTRSLDPMDAVIEDRPDAASFLDTLVRHSALETTALLLALAALLPDNYLAQRARHTARHRTHPVPAWLRHLDEAAPGTAVASTDVLGDGENVIVSMDLPGGHPLSAVVYIDHNLGTVVKDAFVVPEPPESYRTYVLALAEDPAGMEVTDLDPAEARARMLQGIEMGAVMSRLETDTWPACRPIVAWMIGRLPATGRGFDQPVWSEGQRFSIVAEFMRSPEAGPLTGPDDARIALDLLRFTTDYSGGDPHRWSFVNVEILLSDWFLRTISADDRYLRRMPTVLRALVRYSHRQKDIPPHLTDQTLAAVDAWEPVYLETLTTRGQLADSPFARVAGRYGDELMGQWSVEPREWAVRAVGSEEALRALDDAPLPDEEFSWDAIPEDVHERVADVLRMCDGCAEEMFDGELRTAFRRVLVSARRAELVRVRDETP